jgi:uncharacterized OsmC-like protein
MDVQELRDRQRPIKERYREDPSSAVVPAHAEAIVDVSSLSCEVRAGDVVVQAGLHPAVAGEGGQACAADLLLLSVAACAGVTLSSVATAMEVSVRSARVLVDGHWDARGTLAVDRTSPVGLTDVTLTIELDTDADERTVQRLGELTERYCVIAQTLVSPPALTVRAVTVDPSA